MADVTDVSVHKALSKIVGAWVNRLEFAVIQTQVREGGANFTVLAHPDGIGKLIGKQGPGRE